MYLSGIIFVVVAAGWGIYLLPKAVRRHDEGTQPVDSFSDSVRVVGRTGVAQPGVRQTGAAQPDVTRTGVTPVAEPEAAPRTGTRRHTVTREAARKAARRRRHVLALLLLALLGTVGTSYFAVTPWWSTAVPGGLIVVFLIVARVTVRAQQARSVVASRAVPVPAAAMPIVTEPDLAAEDTTEISSEELAAAVADPAADDGGLWDPVPVTLPTYVNKARAHRTVRTIELTGMTSSGHDAADSALAREAEEARQAEESETTAAARKAAGA